MKKNNKIISYILILISLFIIVLFTKNYIFELQAKLEEKSTITKKVSEKREEFKEVKNIKSSLEENWDELDVQKYVTEIKEDDIVDYIYSMIEDGNSWKTTPTSYWLAFVNSLSISKWKKNEIWFLESDITLNLRVEKELRMKKILDFFTSKDSKYKFFITSFSYNKPGFTQVKSNDKSFFDITIPLKVFYK